MMKHLKTYQIFETDLKPEVPRAPYRQGKETFPSKGKAYHLTPDIHLEEIKRVGLKLKTENKLENHPERIYLFLNGENPEDYKSLTSQIWNSSRDKERIKNYYLLEIDLTKLPSHRYFSDPASGISSWIGIYTDQSIPPSVIKVKEKIPVGSLPKSNVKDNLEDLKDEIYMKTGFWPAEKEETINPAPPKKTPEEIKMEKEREKERKEKRDAFFASMKGNLPKDGVVFLPPEMLG